MWVQIAAKGVEAHFFRVGFQEADGAGTWVAAQVGPCGGRERCSVGVLNVFGVLKERVRVEAVATFLHKVYKSVATVHCTLIGVHRNGGKFWLRVSAELALRHGPFQVRQLRVKIDEDRGGAQGVEGVVGD
jgi:hypothetical protein